MISSSPSRSLSLSDSTFVMMSSNKSSSKSKQTRASCLFFCLNVSAVADPEQLAAAPGAATDSTKQRCSWFTRSRFRKKKKKRPPVAPSISAPSNTGPQLGAKEKINHNQSRPQSPPAPQTSTITDAQVSANSQNTHRPHLTSKYSTRARPEPQSHRSEPVYNRVKHSRSGSSEPGQPQATGSRVATKERTGQPRKVDTKAGLAVLGMTLGVMVFYGRVAAVVCLCAFLYIAALLRQPKLDEEEGEAGEARVDGEGDMKSKDYRKRIVLKGFLARDSRRPLSLGYAF